MSRRRHTPEQVVRKLREADRLLGEGIELPEVSSIWRSSEATYHRWRDQFGGMKADDVKRLKELEAENPSSSGSSPIRCSEIQALKEIAERETSEPVASTPSGPACFRTVSGSRSGGRAGCRVSPARPSAMRRLVAQDDAALRAQLRAFSRERPRWGYRQAHQHLLEQGWTINRKRTQRLWREEGLRVPAEAPQAPAARGFDGAGRPAAGGAPRSRVGVRLSVRRHRRRPGGEAALCRRRVHPRGVGDGGRAADRRRQGRRRARPDRRRAAAAARSSCAVTTGRR